MRADEDGLAGSPWYVRLLVRVGVPTAFASALLWFLITNVTGNVTTILHDQQALQHTGDLVLQNQTRILDLLYDLQKTEQSHAAVLGALCYNASETDADRQRCVVALTAVK